MTSLNFNTNLNGIDRYKRYASKPAVFSKLSVYKDRIISSDKGNFISSNRDLINVISGNDELSSILNSKTVTGRDDLKDVIVSGALDRLDSSSPIKRSFLEDNFDFAEFIALNIGSIADILNDNKDLAETIVDKGDAAQGIIFSQLTDKVESVLGTNPYITSDFIDAHPEAGIYLLEHRDILKQVKDDRTKAKTFVDEIGSNSDTYNNEIASIAKSLIDMPSKFDTTFLQDNQEFAQMVVASELGDESLKLASYIKSNPDITLDDFTTSDIVNAYQADLAVGRFEEEFPLAGNFLTRNMSIATAIIGSEEFASNLNNESQRIEEFFGPRRSQVKLDKNTIDTVNNIYNSIFETHSLPSINIDLFV